MSEYDSLTSSARLLLLVGHAYLMFPPYRPSFIVCVSASYSRLSCTAGLPYNAGISLNAGSLLLVPFFTRRKTNISGTIRVSQVPQCFSSYMPRPFRHRQTLQVLAIIEPFVLASIFRRTSPSASIIITMLYHASGEHLSPCGLYDSLCTLRVSRSTLCLSFPITQHSVRVVG
jgi:hypothetical protein